VLSSGRKPARAVKGPKREALKEEDVRFDVCAAGHVHGQWNYKIEMGTLFGPLLGRACRSGR
jgi:hypothetical protein